MYVLSGSRGRGDRTLPRSLHAGFSACCTNGLEAGQRFNENAVTGRRFGLQSLHGAIKRTLQGKADQDHDWQHHQRNPRQRPGDDEKDSDEKEGKDQIGRGNHAAGGEELARRIKVTELVRNDADRAWPLRHLYRHHMFEDVGRKHHVHRLSGDVDHPASHHAKQEVERDSEAHPDRQCNQRRDGAVWHDAVVDAHREEGGRQGEHVGQEGSEGNVSIAAPVHLDDRPKPVISRQVAGGDGPRICLRSSPDEERISGVFCGNSVETEHPRGAWLGKRIQDFRALVGLVHSQQDQRSPVSHDQDSRENQGRDVEDSSLDSLGFEPCASGRTVIEGYRQPPIQDWQASQQSLSTYCTAVKGRQIGKRCGKRIVFSGVNPSRPIRFQFRLAFD